MPKLRRGNPRPSAKAKITVDTTVLDATDTTLTLTVSFDQNVKLWFDYGTTTAYGSETTHQDDFTYSTHIQTITGLSAATTYHVRAHGVDRNGNHILGADTTVATDGTSGSITYTDYTPAANTLAAVQVALTAMPSGSSTTVQNRLLLTAGVDYSGSGALSVSGKSYITIEGQGTPVAYAHGTVSGGHTGGAKLRTTGTGSAVVSISGSHHVTFSNLTVQGSNPDGGTPNAFHAGFAYESQAGFRLGASTDNITFDHVITQDCYSDDYAMRGTEASGGVHSLSNILITGCQALRCGRMGVAFFDVTDVEIVDSYWGDVSLIPFDFEPNNTSCVIERINVHHCTFGDHGEATNYDTNQAFVASGGSSSNGWTLRTVTFNDLQQIGVNRSLTGSQMTHMSFWFRETAIAGPVVITNNDASTRMSGSGRLPVYVATSIASATITGNHGFTSIGSGASFVTGTVTSLTQSDND